MLAPTNLVVVRPALLELLDRGAEGPITVVAASAGSGKTVLVRTWLKERRGALPTGWISVERGERDPQRFWSAVVAELVRATPEGRGPQVLTPTPSFDVDAVVRGLLAELTALDLRLALVIDDLHELEAPVARLSLTRFLDHLPGNVHVVLISRRDPELRLHRRRLAGELTEIRGADLRFTLQETKEMLSALEIDVSAESVVQLHERTEGWVAGLRLATMRLIGHADPDAFIAEFSGSERTVAEYLLAEVLDGQAPNVRRLLVRTSLLQRVNGELGDLLTSDSGSEHVLQVLADGGGFVEALDASRTWFRFHHLLSDLLTLELRNSEPEEIAQLHAAAARWFAEHGLVIEAITHAQASGDGQLAAGLLIENYFSLILEGRSATARTLLEAMAPGAVAGSAELAVVAAAEELVAGSLDQAAAHLELAAQAAAAVPAARKPRFEMGLLVTRLSLARRLGDLRAVLDDASAALTVGERNGDQDPSVSSNDLRALALMNLGIGQVWAGQIAEGARHLERARDLAEQTGRPYVEVVCRVHLAQVAAWRSFTRGRAAGTAVIELAERRGWGTDPMLGPALVTVGTSLLQAGRFEEAEHWLARADRTVRTDLEPAVGFQLRLAWGGLHQARGRDADALASFRDAERLGLKLVNGSPLARQLKSSTLRTMVTLGEIEDATRTLAAMSRSERGSGEIREVAAALALALGDAEAAVEELAPTLSGAADVHNDVVVVRSLILDAVARSAIGDSRASEESLERALDVAEANTLILPFAHTPSQALLERHPRHRTAHGGLITSILDVLAGDPPPPEAGPSPPPVEPLSNAELRVLRYLPTNLSATEIAGELYISPHTVKTHVRHVYAKLDAHTRSEAVARARALGLLAHTRLRE